jgi:hypothetical protein
MRRVSVNALAQADQTDKKPDFDQYKFLQTLSASQLRLSDPGRRVIFIGDIHGSYDPLQYVPRCYAYDLTSQTAHGKAQLRLF